MRLLALSDLHVSHPQNRKIIEEIRPCPKDWLILGGDLAEALEDVEHVFAQLAPRFARLVFVPGNHELWVSPLKDPPGMRGEAKYRALIDLCRKYNVLCPEDDYPLLSFGDGPERVEAAVCPLFLLYDYSFCPDGMTPAEAKAWAREARTVCTDEVRLDPAPHASVEAWCAARVKATEARLEALGGAPCVLVNHFPLRRDTVWLPRVPRFSIWCGTRATENWHRRFHARAVVTGHLHMPSTRFRDGVAFEEVSLGYPRERRGQIDINRRIRQVLPRPADARARPGALL